MRTVIFPLADKQQYENYTVIDHSKHINCVDFDGDSLISYIKFFTEWQLKLTRRYPDKQFRIRFEPEGNDQSETTLLYVEVFHVESDEERDARLDIREKAAKQRSEFFAKHSTVG